VKQKYTIIPMYSVVGLGRIHYPHNLRSQASLSGTKRNFISTFDVFFSIFLDIRVNKVIEI